MKEIIRWCPSAPNNHTTSYRPRHQPQLGRHVAHRGNCEYCQKPITRINWYGNHGWNPTQQRFDGQWIATHKIEEWP